MSATPFGHTADGTPVTLYTLDNGQGLQARIMDHGATVVSLRVPDSAGVMGEVILGFESLDDYLRHTAYLGAVVGRFANRMAKGRFTLDGQVRQLACNNGANHLHGGERGFDKRHWQATERHSPLGPQLALRYVSADGEEGYPGELAAEVVYTLTADQSLRIDYEARCGQPTVVNLTNHMYFNLAGGGTTLGHRLRINAGHYLPIDQGLIPTGELASVEGTPMDFRELRVIGAGLTLPSEQLELAGGYDHNWVLDQPRGVLAVAAEVHEPLSGRHMTVLTTQPGLQFYSGNQLDGSQTGRSGERHVRHAGFCLETQHFPDSPNQAHFPSVTLRPGEVYQHSTVYRFA
ncbi:MAG: galactose mutarotase [Pseudomonas sp.]|uniref:aldose epimerase family protein n=1 Tax=Pseudomonas sp. TaxID=306 RepID=UPI00120E1011|nr:aldose epimerase family protein [Pseudomonas sp.]RZI74189.1 MAG: galactose mutarotase [Pseudomonas sp.]